MQCVTTVYLSGSGSDWRQEAMAKFHKIAKYDDTKICVVNPTDFVGGEVITDRQIKSFLFDKIRQSDIVICNLRGTEHDPYTASEVQYAVDNHITVLGIRGEDACSWLEHVDCDAVFGDVEEAVRYVRNFYVASSKPLGGE